MKIIDKIEDFRAKGKPFYSFEFFPPKTEAGLQNLYQRLDRMAGMEPAFVDITWGAGGSSNKLSVEITENIQRYFGLDVMMHLTCTNMTVKEIDDVLAHLRDGGIDNVLALRGDPPAGQETWEKCDKGFSYGSELTAHIREKFNNHFGIAVGGYPEGHIESSSPEECIKHLKTKVDAGADFIVTQLFYDIDAYFKFVERAQQAGITCPIIPGILPIQNYQRFRRIVELCQIHVPDEIEADLRKIKDDDSAVQHYGIDLCADMCRELTSRGVPGLHFYTLNLETSVARVLQKLNFTDDCRLRRPLPWRRSTHPDRQSEEIRPIFWSNRPKSYLTRTSNWDDYPNGRWGDASSPTYGALAEYYLVRRGIGMDSRQEKLRQLWGEPKSVDDIANVFIKFCEGSINRLPWCEMPVQNETTQISANLIKMNQSGMLTINSQPRVNAAPSTDPDVGWGGPNGYVFQKAYVEFFCPREQLAQIIERIDKHPTISYCAVNRAGDHFANIEEGDVTAVTWGVFPGKEILQPTVVDFDSFMIWKTEAFDLWLSEWASIYPKDSEAHKLIRSVHDDYYLVNIVDNDFVNGEMFSLLAEL